MGRGGDEEKKHKVGRAWRCVGCTCQAGRYIVKDPYLFFHRNGFIDQLIVADSRF